MSADKELRRRAIIEAAIAQRPGDVEALLLLGVSPSCCDDVGRSLLHHACHTGDVRVLALVGALSVDVDAPDVVVRSPFPPHTPDILE